MHQNDILSKSDLSHKKDEICETITKALNRLPTDLFILLKLKKVFNLDPLCPIDIVFFCFFVTLTCAVVQELNSKLYLVNI